MSIEKDFGRIATALEKIVGLLEAIPRIDAGNPVAAPKPAEAAAPTPPVKEATPPAPPTQAAAAPAPPVAAPTPPVPSPSMFDTPAVTMTAEQLNAELVKENTRLGGKTQLIFDEIAKLGAKGVSELDPSKYQTLLNSVKAIQA